MYKVIIVAIFLLEFCIVTRAQECQWGHSFVGNGTIMCVETDSQNNLYVFGTGDDTYSYRNEELCIGHSYTIFLVKLDPSGNLLWKKRVRNNNYAIQAHYMRVVGDTSVVVMFATPFHNGMYYLDKSISQNEFPFPAPVGETSNGTEVVAFDTYGNMTEQHIIRTKLLNAAGEPVQLQGGNTVINNSLAVGSSPFLVDENGDFLFSCIYEGTMPGMPDDDAVMRVTVDGRDTFDLPRPATTHMPLLVKVSRGFDSILWCVSTLKSMDLKNDSNQIDITAYTQVTDLMRDPDGSVYLSCNIMYFPPARSGMTGNTYEELIDTNWNVELVLGDGPEERVTLLQGNITTSFFAKYDPQGSLLWCRQITGSPFLPMNSIKAISPRILRGALAPDRNRLYYAVRFDQGANDDTTKYWQFRLTNPTTELPRVRINAGFLCVNTQDGSLISYGIAESSARTSFGQYNDWIPGIVVRHNQVIAQVQYRQDLQAGNTHLSTGDFWNSTIVLHRWHEDGQSLGAIDFQGTSNNRNRQGPMLFDNNGNLIVTGYNAATANICGTSIAPSSYIAKLSDTTFNAPYTHTPWSQTIAWSQPLELPLHGQPLALNATASSRLPVQYSIDNPAVALLRGDTLFPLAPGTATLRANQPGDSWWAPAPELARTLTVAAPQEQTITWEQELTFLHDPYLYVPLTASATSGLPVAYTSDDDYVASIWNGQLCVHNVGTTTIRANQPGDSLYWLPAPEVSLTLTVLSDTTGGDPQGIAPVAPEEILSVEYYDLLGRCLLRIPHPTGTPHHPTPNLPKGIYLKRTVTPHGVTTQKILTP